MATLILSDVTAMSTEDLIRGTRDLISEPMWARPNGRPVRELIYEMLDELEHRESLRLKDWTNGIKRV